MILYILKLIVLIPVIGMMIWGSLKLMQKAQSRFSSPRGKGAVSIVEIVSLSPTQRLIVVDFKGRQILVGSTRQGLVRLADVSCEAGVVGGEL